MKRGSRREKGRSTLDALEIAEGQVRKVRIHCIGDSDKVRGDDKTKKVVGLDVSKQQLIIVKKSITFCLLGLIRFRSLQNVLKYNETFSFMCFTLSI